MSSYTSDTVYSGEENIIIAVDLGTTHSKQIISFMGSSNIRRLEARIDECRRE
jgi:hypothetical protein